VPDSHPNRDEVLSGLAHIQVFQTDSVTVTWSVKHRGEIVKGNQLPGRAMLDAQPNSLKVYVVRAYSSIGSPPLELVEAFAEFAGVDDNAGSLLLSHILSQQSLSSKDIEHELRMRGKAANPYILSPLATSSLVEGKMCPRGSYNFPAC
jgi:hypothetical protein